MTHHLQFMYILVSLYLLSHLTNIFMINYMMHHVQFHNTYILHLIIFIMEMLIAVIMIRRMLILMLFTTLFMMHHTD